MYKLLVESLQVFVVVVMAIFIIMYALAATGNFDSWGKRYKAKRAEDHRRDLEEA
jgi:uncharacterized protein HemY